MQNPISYFARSQSMLKLFSGTKQILVNCLCTRSHILRGAKKPKATGVIINRWTEQFVINFISNQGHLYALSESFHFLGVSPEFFFIRSLPFYLFCSHSLLQNKHFVLKWRSVEVHLLNDLRFLSAFICFYGVYLNFVLRLWPADFASNYQFLGAAFNGDLNLLKSKYILIL